MAKEQVVPQALKKSKPLKNRLKYAIIWIGLIVGLLFSLFYAHYGADFTGISLFQFFGFVFCTIASLFLLLAASMGVLYFGREDADPGISLKVLIIMFLQLMCCVAGVVFFIVLPLPNKREMKAFVIPKTPGVFRRSLWRLEEEARCCGVDSYKDYRYKIDDDKNNYTWTVPLSCCDNRFKEMGETSCILPQNITYKPPDFTQGCFKNIKNVEEFKTLAPDFYLLMNVCRYLIIPLLVVSFIFTITACSYHRIFWKIYKIQLKQMQADEAAEAAAAKAKVISENTTSSTSETGTTRSTFTNNSTETSSLNDESSPGLSPGSGMLSGAGSGALLEQMPAGALQTSAESLNIQNSKNSLNRSRLQNASPNI